MPIVALLLLAGCDYNEKNFDGLDEMTQPENVFKKDYTLIDADYATIANNKANQALAGEAEKSALAAVKTNLCLTDIITAQKYVPAFLAATYYTASTGSSVRLTYQQAVEVPAYLAQVEAAKSYKLVDDDYAVAWDQLAVYYFTPSKPAATYLPRILKSGIKDAVSGDYAVAEYNYSATDPSTGGGEVESYDKVADAAEGPDGDYNVKGYVGATYGRGFLLTDGKASVLVYLNKTPNYSLGDVVAVKGTTSTYSGLKQFSAAALVTKLSVGETFAYPAFQPVTGAEMDTYFTTPTVKPVTYVGTLAISGNYFNITGIEGAATAQGSLSYPAVGTIDPALDGQKVKVSGFTIGVSSGKFVNTMVTSVVAADATTAPTAIGVVALAASGAYQVQGAVVATYINGFLLNDGTGSILVYLNAAHDYTVGDVVTVSGTTSKYSGLNQFPATSTVTKAATKVTVSYPAIRALAAADIDAYITAPYAQYVSYKGTLSISGNKYYNVLIDGTDVQGSISYPNAGLVNPDLNGKEVIVTGYTIGTSGTGTKFVNMMALSVVEATAAPAALRLAITRAAGNSEKRYAIYQLDGTQWAVAPNMSMVNPSDYRKMGLTTDYFSSTANPNNYLASFMRLTYPYGQEGETATAVYHYYDKEVTTIGAQEFVFTNGAWAKNTNIVVATDQFVYDGTKWNYDPSTVITLSTSKGDTEASKFYQTITDWVKANKGAQYVTSYGNNDYYYGGSAYNNNFDFRYSAWRTQLASEYGAMTDDELKELMFSRLTEAFLPGLEKLYGDVDVVPGVDVIFTINFFIYDSNKVTSPYTIQYKVIGKGKFEYIKDTLKAVKE